jgi:ubiquinone biosynthesis protein
LRLNSLAHSIRDIRRTRQIITILVRYGFGYFVDRMKLSQHLLGKKIIRFGPIRKMQIFDLSPCVRLRKTLEELGPTFIKLGQILSTRPDILPIEYCRELETLQDKVPAFDYAKVEEQVRRELKRPIAELFDEFSREPVAAASLGQAHTARLKNGEKVIVKIQRPGIEKTIQTDLEILEEIARLAEKHIEESRVFDPVGVVSEFRQAILQELDYTRESENIARFQAQFAADATVYIPKCYPEFSSRRILTMERVEGIKINQLEKIDKAGLSRKKLALHGANAFLKQIFEHGFFHADPHPGNLMAQPGNRVAFIDFGMVGRIHHETKIFLSDILIGVADRDIDKIADRFLVLGAIDDNANLKKFEMDIEDFLDRHLVATLKEVKVGQFLVDLVTMVADNRIRLPADLYLLSKAMVMIEGLGVELDPDFDMAKLIKPFVRRLVIKRRSPGTVFKELKKFFEILYDWGLSFPRDLKTIFNKLKKGTLKVEFEHRGLENLITELDKDTNRIAFSVIVAAIIVGSSLIIQSDKGPHLLGYPVIGILGYGIAGFMGLWLLIAIIRSGRL